MIAQVDALPPVDEHAAMLVRLEHLEPTQNPRSWWQRAKRPAHGGYPTPLRAGGWRYACEALEGERPKIEVVP